MGYLIGIDVGTSGTKTVLFQPDGTPVASCTVNYPMSQPQNGWAEQNPEDWWQAVRESIRGVLAQGGAGGGDIAAVGLSGQMHGLVLLDETGAVLRPAILWCDQRTEEECGEITQRVGARKLLEITANPAVTGFTAGKLLWVQRHEPEIYGRCRQVLLPKDYIRYRLTGEFASEVSDASGTGFLDVPLRQWSQEVLRLLEIDPALLPPVYESPEISGRVSRWAAEETGLVAGTPVAGGGGDNAAAAVGMGVVESGTAFVSIGTSGVLYAHTDRPAVDFGGRVHAMCCAVPGAWHIMGVTQAAGLSLQWLRNQCCEGENRRASEEGTEVYQLLDDMASGISPGADRLLYLPYLMGERTPHLDPQCRGAFVGLSAMHTRAHLVRAVMEGVAFSLRDCTEVFGEMGACPSQILACGGGGTSRLWRQILADVLSIPLGTARNREGPALGAALLAAVGIGMYRTVPEACAAAVHREELQSPCPESSAVYRRIYPVYQGLYPTLKETHAALAVL